MRAMAAVLAVALAGVPSAAQQTSSLPAAVPVPAIPAILEAFRTHDVVVLSDGGDQGFAFRVSLVQDPRFAQIANDIVVESGNSRYQDVMDHYTHGEDMPETAIRQAWQNTTMPNATWDGPMYQNFFRAVRTVNASLPRERQLRVLLGDPPIDWSQIRGRDDHRKWIGMRDTYPVEVIQREVLAKHRRALVVYGVMHLQRKNIEANYESTGSAESLVSRLEATTGATVFTAWPGANDPKLPGISKWPYPSLALLRGSDLGATDFSAFIDVPGRFTIRDGGLVPIPKEEWRSLRVEDQADAILYLGPESWDPLESTCRHASLSIL